MSSKKDYFKHDASCLFMQVFFVVVYLFFLFQGMLGKTLAVDYQFYMAAVVTWFCFSLLVFGVFNKFPRARHFMTIVAMMVNAFIIPRATLSCGIPLEIVALTGAMYVVAVIVVSSNDVAFAAFVASIAFAAYFHNKISNLVPDYTQSAYMQIAMAYLGLIVVALGWRAVLTRLYRLVRHLPMPGQVSEEDYEMVEGENSLLRQKIAKIIISIQKMTGSESNSGKEQ